MIALSQDSKAFIDMCAGEIQQLVQQTQAGETVVTGYQIVLFGFNISFPVAIYGTEEEAMAVFMDLLAHLKNGKEFYDIRARERAIFKRK